MKNIFKDKAKDVYFLDKEHELKISEESFDKIKKREHTK